MIDAFDSRALRRTDCYAQRFMKAGTYPYNVLPAFCDFMQRERPFLIKVAEKQTKAGMTQHNVFVRQSKDGFAVGQAELTIAVGDLVLWNCLESRATPYCVVGEKEFFSSNRMINECGYTHAFGMAGEYRWRDAYGSDVHGVVHVRDPQCKDRAQLNQWQEKTLKQGTLVMIDGSKAEPSAIEIVTGQTVFFAVVKGTGISITDERILDIHSGPKKAAGTCGTTVER